MAREKRMWKPIENTYLKPPINKKKTEHASPKGDCNVKDDVLQHLSSEMEGEKEPNLQRKRCGKKWIMEGGYMENCKAGENSGFDLQVIEDSSEGKGWTESGSLKGSMVYIKHKGLTNIEASY